MRRILFYLLEYNMFVSMVNPIFMFLIYYKTNAIATSIGISLRTILRYLNLMRFKFTASSPEHPSIPLSSGYRNLAFIVVIVDRKIKTAMRYELRIISASITICVATF